MEVTESGIILDNRPRLIREPPARLTPHFVNTDEFRREALYFEKHGYYCPDPSGTIAYNDYWDEQTRRCDPEGDGYTVGGVTITGDHYAYLNFGQIRLTAKAAEDPVLVGEVRKKRKGTKRVFFPDFWDGDWLYFHELKNAREAAEHMIVLKSRRRGYSFKNGFILANRYNHVKNSISVIGAFLKEYLYPEGTMTMATNYLNFFNQHTAWRKRRQAVDKQHHRKASYYQDIEGATVEMGYKSQIIAITFKDNPSAARGKDGTLILFEEAGKFPNLKASIQATIPTLEDGLYATGQMIVFGTGGDEGANWADFENVFYNPSTLGFRSFENTFDESASGTFVGFYVPDYLNKVGFIDKDGNSDYTGAIEYELNIRDEMRKSGATTSDIDARVAEFNHTPAEAFLHVGSNSFPAAELLEHYNTLMTSKLHLNLGMNGKFVHTEDGLKFRPDTRLNPVYKYPLTKGDKQTGCVVMYSPPIRDIHGKVPEDLYFICHDPYAHKEGESLGAAYVMQRIHPKYRPDDRIVASYVGRPEDMDLYNEQLFRLAEYYNCKIGFENDRGDVIGYAKRTRQIHRLQEEFELDFAKELMSNVNRDFGMHMTKERKKTGIQYLRDWLTTKRGVSSDGKQRLNLHYIYDPALLQELIKFVNDPKKNFDRVSAMIVGMYYMKELSWESDQTAQMAMHQEPEEDSVFFRSLY